MKNWRRYHDVAETYARVTAPHTGVVAADLVAFAGPPIGARALDIGTGTGAAAAASAAAVGDSGLAVGADLSAEMVAAARRARPDLPFVAAEAIQLPFRDATFDLVTATFVLDEFRRHDTALFDLIRVLRPGGELAAASWASYEDELSVLWRTLVEETIGRELYRSTLREATPGAARFGDPNRFQDTLREAGLKPVRIEKRSYRFAMPRGDYVADRASGPLGRFVREMLGARGWQSFLDRAVRTFADRYGAEIHDSRDVLLAVGTKP